MLDEELVADMRSAVEQCNEARSRLREALRAAEAEEDPGEETLQSVARALEAWRDGQRAFMSAVDASEGGDVSTVAMLLKANHGIDSTEARRGLPGVSVDGADQPFDLDLSGTRGTLLTTAAMEYVSD